MSIVNLPPVEEVEALAQLSKEELALLKYEEDYPEDLRKALSDIISDLEKQQKTIRQANIMEWKKNDYYWQSLQNIFFSEAANDWRPFEDGVEDDDSNMSANDIGRVINVYRSYGESIIAGLSATLPGVRFAPDNADNPDDISTAKAYGKIANLIHIHNNASSLFIKALFILFNQSFVAAYNYHHTSPEYGTVKTPKTVETEQEVAHEVCPNCGEALDEVEDDVYSEESITKTCPTCMQMVTPEIINQTEKVLIPTYEDYPKSREIIELYGPMNVQVPFYISDIKNTPYLILESEHHVSLAKALFPHLDKKITAENSYSSYERWARQPSEAFETQSLDLVTFRRIWLRPWAYWMLQDDAMREEFQEKYPNGVYILFLNDLFAEACPENMDDHWTISQSPTSTYIHAAPIGRTLIDIQEMTNDMYNLTLRTILYGIPMTFAESNAIDWDKFSKTPSEPGMVYPAKVQPGQNLTGMFHTVKTATLSREVDSFGDRLTQAGQFVSGAFPSIYGGSLEGGSGTYKEYESSRNQALQRLSLIWKMLNIWWKDTTFKACKEYARNLQFDESYSQRNGNSYINVWIKRAELQGKIGEVEAESSDQFPISDAQKRSLIMEFINSGNEFIGGILRHPENIGSIARLVGMGQLYIPGDDQRNKQLVENLQLMVSAPMPGQEFDSETQQPIMVSSVPIEEVDVDEIHSETAQAFLVSDSGQYLKQSNPEGYQNVMLHLQEHQMRIQEKAMQAALQQAQMENVNGGGKPSDSQPPKQS